MTTIQTGESRAETIVARQMEALSRHDTKALASFYNPDVVVADPQYDEPLRGTEAVVRDYADFVRAFPDLEVTPGEVLAKGNGYAFEFWISGTHDGPLIGPGGHIPATGKRVKVRGSVFGRLDSQGRIVEEHRHYDLAGLLGQIGLLH